MPIRTLPSPLPLHGLKAARRRAAHVLWVERALPALKRPAWVLGCYTFACLIRLPQRLPDILHALLECVLLGLVIKLVWQGLRRIQPATPEQIDRRIEAASGFTHHPLLTLQDHPAGQSNDPAQAALWAAHIERTLQNIGPLRAGFPVIFKTGHTTRLHRALTGFGGVCLLVSVLLAGFHTPSRLWAGYVPGQDDADAALPTLQAWIDLPSYAPGAPVFLTSQPAPTEALADGSSFTAVIGNAYGTPHIHGATITSLQALDATSWRLQAVMHDSTTLRLSVRGRTIGSWPITIAPNPAPEVLWSGKPGPFQDTLTDTKSWRTALPWQVAQPYGVVSLEADITAADGSGPVRHVRIPLDHHPKSAKGTAQPDLSDDPLAGMEVSARLHAVSASGKEGFSKTEHFHLGQRHFTDPLARAIIALRVRLMLDHETPQTAAQELLLLTQATSARPVLIPLTLLATRLSYEAPSHPEALSNTANALWNLALYLEDLKNHGPEVANASAAVRAAEETLRNYIDGLAQNSDGTTSLKDQQTLHDLTETLKSALAHRMALLFKSAAQSGIVMPNGENSSVDPFSSPLEKLQSQLMQGQAESALKTLQDMEDMAEHMRQAGPQDMQALAETMKKQAEARLDRAALRDLIKRETELLDHTQNRLSAARKAAQPLDNNAPDITQMSTEDLLKQLGMPSPQSASPNVPSSAHSAPLDDATVLEQAPARRDDHALQRALTTVDILLGQHTEATTGKKVDAFDKAKTDMLAARKALAERHDQDAATAEQKVLDDLKNANQQMQKDQKSSSGQGQGSLSFIPPPSPHQGQSKTQKNASQSQNGDQNDPSDGDDDDDDSGSGSNSDKDASGKSAAGKNQDPLGRNMGEGHDGQDSDAHIPDKNTRDRARDIEQELRRRAADRTRPQSELDYLQRLLKAF